MTKGPIRAGSLLRRSTSRPREAFQPRLAALPRCLDTASTTDVSRHEHPRSTPPLETSCLAPWENPPALDSQGRPWDATFPSFAQARAEPPCGHSASNGFVLGRHAAGFGSTGHHIFVPEHFSWGGAPPLFRRMAARPHRALWHLSPATGRNAKRPDAHRLSPFRPVHANATDRHELRGAFHRARPARALFRGSWGAPPSLAGEFGAARVHRCSKTSTRPLAARCSRAPSRPRALVRLLQVNALTSTTEDRSNIPNHRNPWLGRLPCSFRKFPSEPRATADASQGQGSRTPSLDIPHYDCS